MSTYHVYIPGVAGDGDIQVGGTLQSIKCTSLMHGIDLPVVLKGVSRTAGYSLHGSILLTHRIDAATPKLREKAAQQSALGKVEIIRKEMSDGLSVEAEKISLGKCRLAAVVMETMANGDGTGLAANPLERFTLDYEEIVWDIKYTNPETNGTERVTGGWDTDHQMKISQIPAVETGTSG